MENCPFCSSEAKKHDGSIKDSCFCPNENCILFARIFSIKAWNTRDTKEVEELREACKKARRIARKTKNAVGITSGIHSELYKIDKLLQKALSVKDN